MTDECKVCRVLAERDLDGYDDRLLSQWRGDGTNRKGYRQLARWLNVTLLRQEMDEAGLPTLGNEAESKYERLRGGDTNAAEVATILEREGIDVDRLRDDFVSYGVVRTHLTGCLDAEYDPDEPDDWETDAIDIATEHAREKIRAAVRSLARKGEVGLDDDLAVHLSVELECENCRTRVSLRRALRREGGCRCGAEVTGDD